MDLLASKSISAALMQPKESMIKCHKAENLVEEIEPAIGEIILWSWSQIVLAEPNLARKRRVVIKADGPPTGFGLERKVRQRPLLHGHNRVGSVRHETTGIWKKYHFLLKNFQFELTCCR